MVGKLCMITGIRSIDYFQESRPRWFLNKKLAGGGIGMNYNVFPELFVGIYNCVKAGRIDDAMKLQNALAEFLDPVFKAGLYEAGQYSVQLRFGADMRCFREPGCVRELNDDEKAAVKATMENLDRVVAEVLH